MGVKDKIGRNGRGYGTACRASAAPASASLQSNTGLTPLPQPKDGLDGKCSGVRRLIRERPAESSRYRQVGESVSSQSGPQSFRIRLRAVHWGEAGSRVTPSNSR